jgi:hypothetical protein
MITVNPDGSVIADIEEKILFEEYEADQEAAALALVYDVKLFFGAAAYACISYDCGNKLDIKLEAGKGAVHSLLNYADEQKQRAAELLSKAQLASEAAQFLTEKGKG